MSQEFGVTISSKLCDQDIRNSRSFSFVSVVDLRRCINNGPLPIEESTLRKLTNFRVAYEQLPMTLYGDNARQQNDLFRVITEQRGNVLVLTDEVAPMARFCQDLDIPFSNEELMDTNSASDGLVARISSQRMPMAHSGHIAV